MIGVVVARELEFGGGVGAERRVVTRSGGAEVDVGAAGAAIAVPAGIVDRRLAGETLRADIVLGRAAWRGVAALGRPVGIGVATGDEPEAVALGLAGVGGAGAVAVRFFVDRRGGNAALDVRAAGAAGADIGIIRWGPAGIDDDGPADGSVGTLAILLAVKIGRAQLDRRRFAVAAPGVEPPAPGRRAAARRILGARAARRRLDKVQMALPTLEAADPNERAGPKEKSSGGAW